MHTTQTDNADPRHVLEGMTRDELKILAKKLNLSGYSRLQKSALIDLLLETDREALNAFLHPTWWRKYHNHVYGAASLVGVVLAVLFFFWPGPKNPQIREAEEQAPDVVRGRHSNGSELAIDGIGDDFVMNTNAARRDEVLRIDVDWSVEPTGSVLLDGIDVATLETLFRERFIDPNDRQNESPAAKELLAFMQKHPEVLAHGYAVSPNRADYRVTIDGLSVQASFASKELKLSFVEFCKDADELELKDGLWAWWD